MLAMLEEVGKANGVVIEQLQGAKHQSISDYSTWLNYLFSLLLAIISRAIAAIKTGNLAIPKSHVVTPVMRKTVRVAEISTRAIAIALNV